MPRISVIIPAYNSAPFLSRTVESVLAQTFTDWELILVNDGSKDSTLAIAQELAERDSRIRVIDQPNGGVSEARNTGYAHSAPTTEYVIFLDADDLWEPDTLAVLLPVAEANPDAVGVHGRLRYIDGSGQPVAPYEVVEKPVLERRTIEGDQIVSRPEAMRTDFAMLATKNCIATPGVVLLRRTMLERAGRFNRFFPPCEDWDMWLRMARLGSFVYVNRIVLAYRRHDSNASSQGEKMGNSRNRVIFSLIQSSETTPEQRRLLCIGYRAIEQRIRAGWQERAWYSFRKGQVVSALKCWRHVLLCYRDILRGYPRVALPE